MWGTPEQVVERYRARHAVLGPTAPTACVAFAGLPYADAHRSL